MSPLNLARISCLLVAAGLFGCSETATDREVVFGETNANSGQTIRLETHDADLLETSFEADSTDFHLRSGVIKVGSATVTYRGREVFTLPEPGISIKLIKLDDRLTISIDGEPVAAVDIAA